MTTPPPERRDPSGRDLPVDPVRSEPRSTERRAADRRSEERRAGASAPRVVEGLMTTGSHAAAMPVAHVQYPLTAAQTSVLVREALLEDEAFNDVTTLATVLTTRHARGHIIARSAGVVAGLPLAIEVFRQVDPRISVRVDVPDGGVLATGVPLVFITGHARGILSAERVALNFLQRLSGIASLTAKFVAAVAGTGTRILDTRKTTPGWRKLEKYAVRAGGGHNHRMDLATAVLIKDNHLAAVDGDVAFAVRRARELAPPGARVEIECDTRAQVEAALGAGADIVMLDNMTLDQMRDCAALCKGRAITEASGGVRLDSVRRIAETGVDWISVGALTHSAPALDLALDFD